MHLRSKYTVDKSGKTSGAEDFGNVKFPSKENEKPADVNSDGNDEASPQSIAKESLTFLVNCVNDRWKMPVAYFLIHKLDTDDQAFLIEEVVYFLESNQIDVVSVTFDGLKTNLSTAKKLGASLDPENLQPYFYSFFGTKIYVIFDICHMLKLIRNNFYGRKQFINRNGKKIFWSYLPTLHNVQQKEKLHLGNRITKRHIKFTKSKMKVNLAAQLLSNSVAASLRYLATDGNYKAKFKNVEPTAEFIEKVNNLFDIFNSRKVDGKIFGQALKPENIEYLSQYLDHCAAYIKGLQVKKSPPRKRKSKKKPKQTTRNSGKIFAKKFTRNSEKEGSESSFTEHEDEDIDSEIYLHENNNLDPLATVTTADEVSSKDDEEDNWEDMYEDAELEPGYEWVLKSNVHTGFLGFLVAIESFKGLYHDQVVEKMDLEYIFTYKFSQDHLETFFSAVRARGGFNDNPSPAQFRDAYRKLIMNKGVKVSNGNCKLEEIICVRTFNDLDESIPASHFIDDEGENELTYNDTMELELYSNFEYSEYKSNVLAYIAGFIKKKILKLIDCSTCLQFLNENEKENDLLKFKQWGKLTKANDNLIKMCKVGENVFTQIDRFNQKDVSKFSSMCFRSVNLNNLCTPVCNVERINDHTYYFLKMIFDYFLKIRLHHAAKLDTLNSTQEFIRNQCKKLPLFKNQ